MVAGGIVAITHDFPDIEARYREVVISFNVINSGGRHAHYFWAEQFFFHDLSGGYPGLQNRGQNGHFFIFSLWGAKGWQLPENSPVECSFFDHEGSGVACEVQYPWSEGTKYSFILTFHPINVSNGWHLHILDSSNHQTYDVATILVNKQQDYLQGSFNAFVEEFSQGSQQLSHCDDAASSHAILYKPSVFGQACPPPTDSPPT